MSAPSANRKGDEVSCVEHATSKGGQLLDGSADVHEAKLPLARLGDRASCLGHTELGSLGAKPHTSFVAEGSATVLINGRPAGRHGSGVSPLGATLVGAEQVFVGGPSVALPSNLTVDGDDDFKRATYALLAVIAGTPSGQQLFSDIERGAPRTVRIAQRPGAPGVVDDTTGHANGLKVGEGGDARVNFDPTWVEDHPQAAGMDAVLFHELMHARGHVHDHHYPHAELTPEQREALTQPGATQRGQTGTGENHCTDGTEDDGTDSLFDAWCGENRAVGIYPYGESYPSENTYRRDRGYGPRTRHLR